MSLARATRLCSPPLSAPRLALDLIPRKQEGAQNSSDLLFWHLGRERPDFFENTQLGVEVLTGLRVITDVEPLAHDRAACIGREFADQNFQKHGFARSVGAQNAEAVAPPQCEIEIGKQGAIVVFFREVLNLQDPVASPRGGGK